MVLTDTIYSAMIIYRKGCCPCLYRTTKEKSCNDCWRNHSSLTLEYFYSNFNGSIIQYFEGLVNMTMVILANFIVISR